jgi:hypothetical protein
MHYLERNGRTFLCVRENLLLHIHHLGFYALRPSHIPVERPKDPSPVMGPVFQRQEEHTRCSPDNTMPALPRGLDGGRLTREGGRCNQRQWFPNTLVARVEDAVGSQKRTWDGQL